MDFLRVICISIDLSETFCKTISTGVTTNRLTSDFPAVLPGGRIPAKKLKRCGEKVGRKNVWPNYTKGGGKGAEENFLKKFLF